MLKLLAIVVASILTVITVRRVFEQLKAQRARVQTRNPDPQRTVTRLRQDPKTGIYYPE
jgi:hypothetical protein